MKGRRIIVLLGLFFIAAGQVFPAVQVEIKVTPDSEVNIVHGSGKIAEKTVQVADFVGVSLKTMGILFIRVGDEEGFHIEAEDNLIPYFEIEVTDGTVEIRYRGPVVLQPTRPVHFYLKAKELHNIELVGSGDIQVPNLKTDSLSVNLLGSGNVSMGDLTAHALKGRIAGSGRLSIPGGGVEEQEITIQGSGHYEARGLQSIKARVHITGSGSTTIQVQDHLEANILGSGSLYFSGSPETRLINVSGSGNIRQLDHAGIPYYP